MAFLDKIKAVFIVPEGSKAGISGQESVASSMPQDQGQSGEAIATDGNLSVDKFLEILSGVLEKHNEPGFDYWEFGKALQSIGKLQHLDEKSKFQTAYAAAQAMNVDSKKLIDSAKKYIAVLELEKNHFQQTANQFIQEQIQKFESTSKQLAIEIQQKQEQIQKLIAEMEDDKKRLSETDRQLQESKKNVEINKAGFMAGYTQLVGQITADIENMEKYLE